MAGLREIALYVNNFKGNFIENRDKDLLPAPITKLRHTVDKWPFYPPQKGFPSHSRIIEMKVYSMVLSIE